MIQGFFSTKKPQKKVTEKGRGDLIKLPNKNITVVVCVLPVKYAVDSTVLLFKIYRLEKYAKLICQLLSAVYMPASCCINEDLLMRWTEHFQKLDRISWKIFAYSRWPCFLILWLNFYSVRNIKLLCLIPHTTNILQPRDRTVFKPLKDICHKEEAALTPRHSSTYITKFWFGKLFAPAWSRKRKPATERWNSPNEQKRCNTMKWHRISKWRVSRKRRGECCCCSKWVLWSKVVTFLSSRCVGKW
jgi:hypothetical protein